MSESGTRLNWLLFDQFYPIVQLQYRDWREVVHAVNSAGIPFIDKECLMKNLLLALTLVTATPTFAQEPASIVPPEPDRVLRQNYRHADLTAAFSRRFFSFADALRKGDILEDLPPPYALLYCDFDRRTISSHYEPGDQTITTCFYNGRAIAEMVNITN